MTKKAIVLLSGGLDSSVTLAVTKKEGFDLIAFTYNYGCPVKYEIEVAKRVASAVGVLEHHVLDLETFMKPLRPRPELYGNLSLPEDRPDLHEDPSTYLPARNLNFWAPAISYAEIIGAERIRTGDMGFDPAHAPDCQESFYDAFNAALKVGSFPKVADRLVIDSPCHGKTKAEIIKMGQDAGLDLSLTFSCFSPANDGVSQFLKHCGECWSCKMRSDAFKELRLRDPAL